MSSIDLQCPVCGYDLGFKPWNDGSPADEICPSCGIHFGYTDAAGGDMNARKDVYAAWRSDWIRRGCPWSSVGQLPPHGWDPAAQLALAGLSPPA